MDELVVQLLEEVNLLVKETTISNEDKDIPFSEFGIDSLMMVQLIVKIEERYNVEIPDSKLVFSELNTINKLAKLIYSLTNIENISVT